MLHLQRAQQPLHLLELLGGYDGPGGLGAILGRGLLPELLQVAAQCRQTLGLGQLEGMAHLDGPGLDRKCVVYGMVLLPLVEPDLDGPLDLQQVLDGGRPRGRHHPHRHQLLDIAVEELPEHIGQLPHAHGYLDLNPVHLDIMDVRCNVRVHLRAHLDVLDPQVGAHLLDLGRAGAGGGGHPHYQPVVALVLLGDGHVRVVAYTSMSFIEQYEAYVPQRHPLHAQVVGHDLWGGGDNVALDPLRLPLLRIDLPGEHRHPLAHQLVLQEQSVLLHQGLGGREQEHLPLLGHQHVRDDQQCDDGLPHARGKDHECGGAQAGVRQGSLIGPILDALPGDEGMLHEHEPQHDGGR